MTDLNLAVLRRLLSERKRIDGNIYNVASSMLTPGTKLQYQANEREYYGVVVGICGIPSTTRVRVRNLRTQKEREIGLYQITGIVQEQ
jgi:hypothetical protein